MLGPAGLAPAAPSGAPSRAPLPRAPALPLPPPAPAARRWLLLRWPGRGRPQQTCHPTPRKRAAPSRLLFVPPPGSALGRRLLPRRAVEVRAPLLARPGGASGSVRLARSEPGPFCLVSPLWTPCGARRRRRSVLGAGAGECRGGAGWSQRRAGESRRGGRPGRTVLEAELRTGGWPAFGVTRQRRLRALPRLPWGASARPLGPGPPWGPLRRGGRVVWGGLCLECVSAQAGAPPGGASGFAGAQPPGSVGRADAGRAPTRAGRVGLGSSLVSPASAGCAAGPEPRGLEAAPPSGWGRRRSSAAGPGSPEDAAGTPPPPPCQLWGTGLRAASG